MIKITNLNKYYNKGKSSELHVINDTSITLDDTGLICILGESGSGKTTLMNTISGLDDFVSGTIEVDDIVINKFGDKNQEKTRNEKFGYIFQNYYLLQDRTVEYNIRLALSLYELTDDECEQRIDYVLNAVDMFRYKKRLVSQLSGGQQQRIAIARALAKTPKVIFADEPTGNLDEANTMKTMSILKKVSKECLVVVVTHERSLADFFADRIIWISDGKVQKEKRQTTQIGTEYQFIDDNNIYLQEFEKKEFEHESVDIATYSNDEIPKVELKIIYENGKVYLYPCGDTHVEILTDDSEKKVVDSKKPKMEIEEVDNYDYSLEELKCTKAPKLKMADIVDIAKSNIKMMGKKKIFLMISLVIMAVLMVLTVQDIMTAMNINEQEIVDSDTHYVQISADKNDVITNDKYDEVTTELIKLFRSSGIDAEIGIVPTVYLEYDYKGFWQMENLSSEFKGYSIVSDEHISSSNLIYGRMPEKPNEVVVDKWVLENFINGDSEVANAITSVKHFLNKQLNLLKKDTALTIVGISDTKQPDIYMNKVEILGISTWSDSMTSFDVLQKAYPDDYKDITLKEGEILVSDSTFDSMVEKYFQKNYRKYSQFQKNYDNKEENPTYDYKTDEYVVADLKEIEATQDITYEKYLEMQANPEKYVTTYTSAYDVEYTVVGHFPDDFGMVMVINKSDYDSLVDSLDIKYKRMLVYTDNKQEVVDFVNNLPSNITSLLNVKANDLYESNMSTYREQRTVKVDERMIITLTIIICTMIILYFMMKTNAVKRISELGVYRLLGISKGSIAMLFAFETALLTTYTSLIGIIVTTAVCKFISSVDALGITLIFPWYAVVLTTIFVYVINIIFGILPIRKILRLPPAQLASKYDI